MHLLQRSPHACTPSQPHMEYKPDRQCPWWQDNAAGEGEVNFDKRPAAASWTDGCWHVADVATAHAKHAVKELQAGRITPQVLRTALCCLQTTHKCPSTSQRMLHVPDKPCMCPQHVVCTACSWQLQLRHFCCCGWLPTALAAGAPRLRPAGTSQRCRTLLTPVVRRSQPWSGSWLMLAASRLGRRAGLQSGAHSTPGVACQMHATCSACGPNVTRVFGQRALLN